MIDIEYKENSLSFYNINFNPEHIFECGQAFRWKREEDGSYTIIAFNKIINIAQDGDKISINNTNKEDFKLIWFDYLDLATDYTRIKEEIPKTPDMERAIEFGYGIRILKQDIFETIISFIISANNGIPQIKNSISKISQRYGQYIGGFNGEEYYSFPSKEALASANPEDLRQYCRVGFRDKRIVEASKMLLDPSFNELLLEEMETEDLKEKLMELPGVGPKVSDCILLFAFARSEVFPVDVWIKRVMEELYIKKTVSKNKISDYARQIFGQNAGYAQQYLFYYGRENDIGKLVK